MIILLLPVVAIVLVRPEPRRRERLPVVRAVITVAEALRDLEGAVDVVIRPIRADIRAEVVVHLERSDLILAAELAHGGHLVLL